MSLLQPDEIGEVARLYAVANTPLFLYKRIRELTAIRKLASTRSPHELISAFNEYANRVDQTAGDVLLAYAAIVALGLSNETGLDWRQVRPRRLSWGNEMVAISRARHSVVTTVTIDAATAPTIGAPPAASTQVSQITLTGITR